MGVGGRIVGGVGVKDEALATRIEVIVDIVSLDGTLANGTSDHGEVQ